MKIIGKRGQKDYYDYLQNTYGIDELVVYDRRNSTKIDTTKTYMMGYNCERWFSPKPTWDDEKMHQCRYYSSNSAIAKGRVDKEADAKKSSPSNIILQGKVYHFCLEVGYHHYFIEVERYLDDNDKDKLTLNYKLLMEEVVERGKRLSEEPMCLCSVRMYTYGRYGVSSYDRRDIVVNPILCDTFIPKLISADIIWKNLYEYISSLRDKEFVDTRTNEQHIESNGFDKKISFRKRK